VARARVGDAVGGCVLLLQDLLQSCARGGRRRVEDMCYERRRAEACVDESAHHAEARGYKTEEKEKKTGFYNLRFILTDFRNCGSEIV
jgi:hypothetical protein